MPPTILEDVRDDLTEADEKRQLAKDLREHPDFRFTESVNGVARRIDHWLNPNYATKRFPLEAVETLLELTGGDRLMPRLEAAAARGRPRPSAPGRAQARGARSRGGWAHAHARRPRPASVGSEAARGGVGRAVA
jgi:hypothetical protein